MNGQNTEINQDIYAKARGGSSAAAEEGETLSLDSSAAAGSDFYQLLPLGGSRGEQLSHSSRTNARKSKKKSGRDGGGSSSAALLTFVVTTAPSCRVATPKSLGLGAAFR